MTKNDWKVALACWLWGMFGMFILRLVEFYN